MYKTCIQPPSPIIHRPPSGVRIPRQTSHHSHAFTIAELLVVLGIMIILIGISWETLSSFSNSARREGAINTVSVSTQVVRALSNQPRPLLSDPLSHNDAATLITTTTNGLQELRFIYPTNANWGGTGQNLYTDFPEREPARLSNNMAVAGIVQPGTTNLLSPPFAIRFNRYGQQVIAPANTTNATQCVWYDLNADSTADPNEQIPCVAGVVVYSSSLSKGAVQTANTNVTLSNSSGLIHTNTTIADLVNKADGKLIFFSRYTGTPVFEGMK